MFKYFSLIFLFAPSFVFAEWQNLWLHPASGFSYNPLSETGFQMIRFEGYMQDNVTYEGFFSSNPIVAEARFIRGNETRVLEIPIENVKIDEEGTHYLFEIALPPDLLEEGEWTPEVYFELPALATVSRMTDDEGNPETITIDTTSPEVTFRYNPNTFTNQPISVEVLCTDASGCAPSAFREFFVRGNFNDEQNGGPRGFAVCDEVGNCTNPEETKLSINFYDPIPPRAENGVRLMRDGNTWRDGQGTFAENKLEAHESFIFEIDGVTDEDNDLLRAEYADQFDNHACGSDVPQNPFYLKENSCATKIVSCAFNAVEHRSIRQSEGEECVRDDGIDVFCRDDTFPFCLPFRLSYPPMDMGFPLILPFFLEGR